MKQTFATWTSLLVGAVLAMPGSAASLVSDAQTLGVNAAANLRIPDARTFTVAAAGQVQVTLRDLGTPTGGATGFTKLKAIVTRGFTKVASLATAGTVQFDATPGTYKVQVVGTAVSPTGTFDIVVQTVPANAPLLQFADGIEAAPVAGNPAQSTLDVNFAINTPGTYQVALTDRALPSALASLDLLVLRQGVVPVTLSGPCNVTACTANFTVATAGNYNLLVIATGTATDQAGLYSVSVSGGPAAATVYSATHPVGLMPAAQPVTLPAGAGLALTLADFAVPEALSSVRAMLVQGATNLGSQSGPGVATLATATAGTAGLYVFAKPASGGAGSFGTSIGPTGGTAIYRDVRAVPEGFDATKNVGGYRYAFNVASAGTYRSQLRDLTFPSAFGTLRGVLVQNGSVVQPLASGAVSTPTLSAGSATAVVFGSPVTAGTNSLFGLSVGPASGSALLDQAQGVGPLIATRNFDIATAGSQDLTVDDLLFPDSFAELAVAVTEGSSLVGQIFGGGKITFNAAAGPHAISLLARPAVAAEYATWGFDVSTTPPAPVVTLTSGASSVASGDTVSLTWSATNATNCAASGGWTGSKSFSGTETSAAMQVDTTFTLTCIGTGGSSIKSVTVTIATAQAARSGGGTLDWLLLCLLALIAMHALHRRRASFQ
jgi:hypothetical protein